MSGEGKSVSFRRTLDTTKTNKQLLKEFQLIIYSSRVVMHMKWYGKDRSVDILEHGDSNRQERNQGVAPKFDMASILTEIDTPNTQRFSRDFELCLSYEELCRLRE